MERLQQVDHSVMLLPRCDTELYNQNVMTTGAHLGDNNHPHLYLYNSVKLGVVVVSSASKFRKVSAGSWSVFPVEFNLNVSHARVQRHLGWLPALVWYRHDAALRTTRVFIWNEPTLGEDVLSEFHFLFNSYFNEENTDLLSCEDAGSTNFLDLLLSDTREESCLDDDWLLGQNTFTQHLQQCSGETRIFHRVDCMSVLDCSWYEETKTGGTLK